MPLRAKELAFWFCKETCLYSDAVPARSPLIMESTMTQELTPADWAMCRSGKLWDSAAHSAALIPFPPVRPYGRIAPLRCAIVHIGRV